MCQSTGTEQLKSPELKGTMSEVIKSGRKGVALKFLLKRLGFGLEASISTRLKKQRSSKGKLKAMMKETQNPDKLSTSQCHQAEIQISVSVVRGKRGHIMKLCVLCPSVANSQKQHHHEEEERQDISLDHKIGHLVLRLQLSHKNLHLSLTLHPTPTHTTIPMLLALTRNDQKKLRL
ncbi:hypothetical protein M758_2G240900 [Ceratodon purpureus]|nr:hypothetical protein M758_2G240900 [Ceratodon purpureus]